MQKLTILAATIAFGALLASAPARADMSGGAPNQNNSGQCFKYSVGQDKDGRFGYWGGCPQTASATTTSSATAATPRTHRRHRTASR